MFSPPEDPSEVAQRAETAARELELKISDHLQQVYGQWTSLTAQQRTELWTLELCRSIGRKSDEVQTLKKEKEIIAQEAAHLKSQVEDLSRLQHPREFKLIPPTTVPMESALMSTLAEAGTSKASTGFDIMDRNLQLDAVVERAISRWKGVVREARGAATGLNAQRSLSGESAQTSEYQSRPKTSPNTGQSVSHIHDPLHIAPELQHNGAGSGQLDNHNHTEPRSMTNGHDLGSDQDADADADAEMEEEDFMDMDNDSHRQPDSTNFPLTNELPKVHPIDGLENAQCVSGYVRIGA